MTRQFQKFAFGFTLVFSLMATAGCVPLLIGAAAGAGGITYAKGALVRNMDESVAELHKASLAAFKDLKFFVVSDELNKHSAVIKAEYEDGQKIQVNVDALTEFVSKITIRVGIIGDQEESQAIFNAIQKRL